MSKINLSRIDLNLLVTFEAPMDTGSVTKAADQVGRTQFAVSHVFARLREPVGDHLMVKVGGKMQPSPFAAQLIKDVRPILRQIKQVVAPRVRFIHLPAHGAFGSRSPPSLRSSLRYLPV